jgi:hypothetical protein
MPLRCAKRGNLHKENNLGQAFSGLSTAFQQILWKTSLSTSQLANGIRPNAAEELLSARDPSNG